MAASPSPRGTVAEKQGATDVKNASAPSASAVDESESKVARVESEAKATVEDTVDESDLEALEESKKIPYARFKEKNDESKKLKERISEMESRYQEDVRLAQSQAEQRALDRFKREQEAESNNSLLDPWERDRRVMESQIKSLEDKLNSVSSKSSERELKSEMKDLLTRYPDADEIEVLVRARANPRADLEELAAESHTRSNEKVELKLRALLEKKKAKAKSSVPTRENLGIKLKDSERPKTVKEANSLLKKFMNGGL